MPKRKQKAAGQNKRKERSPKKRCKNNRKAKDGQGSTDTMESVDYKEKLLSVMKDKGYDGEHFIKQLEVGVEDRLKKRGKPPRMVRYFFSCGWAHALIRNGVGPDDSEYGFPADVLNFLRDIAPGDVKGEIREVRFYWRKV